MPSTASTSPSLTPMPDNEWRHRATQRITEPAGRRSENSATKRIVSRDQAACCASRSRMGRVSS
jgi:hypothetical protein